MRAAEVIALLSLITGTVVAAPLDDKLKEAEDYLRVDPSRTLKILNNIPTPHALTDVQQIRWHIAAMRASVFTGELKQIIDSIEAIFHHQTHPYFIDKLVTVTSGTGIWLRKHDYIIDAQISLECSVKYAINDRQRLTITNSLALLARQLDELEKAKALYSKAQKLAKLADRKNLLAIIENNQGLIALEEGRIERAEQHFRAALAGYQNIDKRSGQISAGVNLLFVFALQQQWVNFQRLYSPTETLTLAFPNEGKQALLLWLNTRFKHMHGEPLTVKEKKRLLDAYTQLDDDRIRKLVSEHLSTGMDMILPGFKKPVTKRFNRPWFEKVKRCDW
ncbi:MULTISPECIES: tetratricopeptide repeat protein [Pseudoalteromonas]|uniref:Tetratricopeptide repeat protein n=1 Tax=Pseudoalteromonas obscura TaxID=3048491 RepID=A0ABT7EL58_9GAMM|nr:MULTISPECIES: tetratricopeptide repeat protein [Pseudoalteromonas]MBQ4837625.1 tetratricopeptide repeat protein [Pseudoalteromonas luteoviolacea]MDK2595794.1 tetratricopeptide repeat protein [Pseudoalteromonas sp. P94(2023)]